MQIRYLISIFWAAPLQVYRKSGVGHPVPNPTRRCTKKSTRTFLMQGYKTILSKREEAAATPGQQRAQQVPIVVDRPKCDNIIKMAKRTKTAPEK